MPEQALAPVTRNCVWMTSGLIRYKLCSRGFDCENCLLDAAMRGEFSEAADPVDDAVWPAGLMSDDFLYSEGHTWLRPPGRDHGLWRLGLDEFAAALIGRVSRVEWSFTKRDLSPGSAACTLDVCSGVISIATPIGCLAVRYNEMLRRHPERIVRQNYGDGWIVELVPTDVTEMLGLMSAAAARERLGLDIRRFYKSVALHLLAAEGASARDALEAGHPLTDLCLLLGPRRHLQLLREFIH